MDAREAEQTLAQVAQRRQQTIQAGTAPWSPGVVWSICSSVLALGVLVDAGMVWLWVVLVVTGVGTSWIRGVRLKPTRASGRWQAALLGTFLLALVVDIAVQLIVRPMGWPLPNTFGAAGAALTIALISRPVQARSAASLRP